MSLSEKDYKKLQEVARFTNISDKPFEHTFAWGSAPPVLHRFDAGESRQLPFPIANHLAKHLAVAILRGRATVAELKNNRTFATPERVAALKQEILSERTRAEGPRPESTNDVIKNHIELLNEADRDVVAPDGTDVSTKADIIAELENRNIKFNARRSKAELQEQLDAVLAGEIIE